MVEVGLSVASKRTRLTPLTSWVMRYATFLIRLIGISETLAVQKSMVSTALKAIA